MSASCPAFLQQEECATELLNGKIRPLYFKYLSAAFGSAMIPIVAPFVIASGLNPVVACVADGDTELSMKAEDLKALYKSAEK